MKLKRIIWGVAALSIFMSSCGKSEDKGTAEVPEYPVTVISKQEAKLESSYPANIKGQEDIEIRPRIDGFIEKMYVDEGSVVRKGQVLFKIDSPSAEATYNSAKAAVVAAEAQVHTAQLNVDRIAPLAKDGIVSVTQLETYKNALESAKASKAQADAQLRNAEATLQWTNVTSPVDGIVGSIPYRLGSLVNSNNVLTTVANTKEVYVYFSINESSLMDILANLEGKTQAEKIKNFPEVQLQLKDGSIHPYGGKISTIGGQVNATTGTAMLRADFPNAENILRSGFSGRVIIPIHLTDVVVIPQKATYSQQDKFMAWKVQGDTVVSSLIEVTPTPDGVNYVVTKGLNPGERIVSDGVFSLKNGMKIAAK